MSKQNIYKIYNWQDISDNYTGKSDLILGNGASIAVSKKFSFTSIKEQAILNENFSPAVLDIFKNSGTDNFEEVLSDLNTARNVNNSLKIKDHKKLLDTSYKEIRLSLINAVREIHPRLNELNQTFIKNISNFLKNFTNIISMNYDLIVHWCTNKYMAQNNNRHAFKDCFINHYFKSDFEVLREPYRKLNQKTVSLVFYPHGNLMLIAESIMNNDKKLHSEASNKLLDVILDKWSDEDCVPRFISEGASEQKMKAIHNSYYLKSVYERVLPKLAKKIVIYGWSMSDVDEHIINQIKKSNPTRIAISVHKPFLQKDKGGISHKAREDINRCMKKLDGIEIDFFDASSAGCWIY